MKEKDDKKKKKIVTGIIIIVCIIIGIVATVLIVNFNNDKNEEEIAKDIIPYTELIKKLDKQEIEKIEMTSGSLSLKIKLKNDEEKYTAVIPSIQPFVELIQKEIADGNDIKLIQKNPNAFITFLAKFAAFLPTIVIIIMFMFLLKLQGLGEKGKVYGGEENNNTNTTFDDVAGLDEEKNELIEVVDFLKKPNNYLEMGAKIPKGILLYGKPGTGKTLIARAIAGEAGVPFISMSGSEFIEMFAGLGASRVRKLFERARKLAPCIVFIDEIDAIGARRTNASGAETENNQTLNQLLVEMDGFEKNETIIILAATNRPEMLDKALLRPGRFDRQITISTPDINGREEILKLHGKDKKFASNIDFRSIAGDTAGFTGAELANVLNEAAIIATKNKHTAISNLDIEDAVKKITVGLAKNNRVISNKDKKLTAFHEAGHAVVSKFLETIEEVKEVSIIPRGVAGGYTMYRTIEDKYYISKTEMEERLVSLLGGRAAEKIALNEISTGASNDIEVATKIARDMVTVYGMSDIIGPISLKDNTDRYQIFGENIENAIGMETKKLIEEAYVKAQKILLDNIDILNKLAEALIEKEIILAEEYKDFFVDKIN